MAEAEKTETPKAEYEVAYKGPSLKWCVIRTKDGQKLKQEIDKKEVAQEWLAEYKKGQPVEKKDNVSILLPPKRCKIGDSVRNVWRAVAEEGHTREDIMSPNYWAHPAQQMRIGDKIEITNDTQTFYMELYVKNVGKGFAQVVELSYQEL